jgi:hypothetical protein
MPDSSNRFGLDALLAAMQKGGLPQGNIAGLPAILQGLGQGALGTEGLSLPLADLISPFNPAAGGLPNPQLPTSLLQNRLGFGV